MDPLRERDERSKWHTRHALVRKVTSNTIGAFRNAISEVIAGRFGKQFVEHEYGVSRAQRYKRVYWG